MECFLEKVIKSSINNLYKYQPNIENFTSNTGLTEWNLAHHLANEIHKYLFWLDCDLEVTKHKSNNKRPDIIFHIRGNHFYNFIVIELKKKDNSGLIKDIFKIEDYWFKEPLFYRYGAVINLKGNGNFEGSICKNSERHEFGYQKDLVGIKNIRKSKELIRLTNEIRMLPDDLNEKDKAEDFIFEIDHLVYDLYELTEDEIKVVKGE